MECLCAKDEECFFPCWLIRSIFSAGLRERDPDAVRIQCDPEHGSNVGSGLIGTARSQQRGSKGLVYPICELVV
jgi:hypothetical protein